MFTGIVQEVGEIRTALERPGATSLEIAATAAFVTALRKGDSVAVAGTCLTVVDRDDHAFWVEMVPETLRRTHLGGLEPGDRVNLEQALRMGDPLGGHLVLGHVDGVAWVTARREDGDSVRLDVRPPAELLPYLPLKAFVALDGVSLTVAGLDTTQQVFTVALIPETRRRTTLGATTEGTALNVEIDPIARYVASLLKAGPGWEGVAPDGSGRELEEA